MLRCVTRTLRPASSSVALRPRAAWLPLQSHRGFRVGSCSRQPRSAGAGADAVASTAPAVDAVDVLLATRMREQKYADVLDLFAQQERAGAKLTVAQWNRMLQASESKGGKSCSKSEMLVALERMRASGVAPDVESYTIVLRACVRGSDPSADRQDGLQLVSQLSELGGATLAVRLLLLELHARLRDTKAAQTVLQDLVTSQQQTRHMAHLALLSAYLRHDASAEFLELIKELRALNRQPWAAEMRNLLKLAVERRSVPATLAIMECALATRDAFNPLPALVMLANAGAFESERERARQLLAGCVPLLMPKQKPSEGARGARNSVDVEHALQRLLPLLDGDVAAKMRLLNVIAMRTRSPRETLDVVDSVVAQGVEAVDSAYEALAQLHGSGVRVCLSSVNLVISMCAQLKDLDRAVETFDAIEGTFGFTADVHSFNALLSAAFRSERFGAHEQVLRRMEAAQLQPDRETFRTIALCLAKAGRDAELQALFDKAKEVGQASGGLYALMIKHALGRFKPSGPGGSVAQSQRDLPRAIALRDEALALGMQLRPMLLEQLQAAAPPARPAPAPASAPPGISGSAAAAAAR